MKRIAVALSAVALCSAVVVPLQSAHAANLCGSNPPPHADSVTGSGLGHGPAGSTATISGSYFTPGPFCTLQVSVGSHNVPSPSANGPGTQISFTTGTGWNGVVSVTLQANADPNARYTDSHLIYVTDPGQGVLDNSKPPVNATVNLVGQGFNFGVTGQTNHAVYNWASPPGGGCAGASSTAGVSSDGTHVGLQMPSQYCDGSVDVVLSVPLDVNAVGPNDSRNVFTRSAVFDIAPQVAGVSPTSAAPGETITVTGSGFGTQGGATISGTTAPVKSWADTAVTVTMPADATSGTLTLTRKFDGQQFPQGKSVGVNAVVSNVSPAQGAVGDTATINGGGFGKQAGTLSVGGKSATVQQWLPTSIGFTVPDGVTPGATTITINTSGTAAPTPSAFKVLPRITGITPPSSTPGSLIEVDGTSFGTQQGTVQIGGLDGSVTLWGDKSVLVMIPAGAAPGQSTVVVTPPNSDAASTTYTIDAPPPSSTPQPGGGGGSGGSPSGAGPTAQSAANAAAPASPGAKPTPGLILPDPGGPVIAHGPVQFVKPTPPPGPVSLRLDAGANQADPGNDVTFTVTLMAFGKAVVGAPVDLVLVIEPGRDASLDPTHAVTDDQGQVKGTIHLSKTPGDHIVLARSGIYSDEVRVVGRGATTAATAGRGVGSASTSSLPPFVSVRSPVLWALLACLLLFGAGFALNLVTAPTPAADGWSTVGANARRDAGYALRQTALGIGSAARYGVALIAVLSAHTVGTLRRR